MNKIFSLLVIFQIKHFLADFPLQGKYMLGKFKSEIHQWFFPLVAHGLVHAIFTFFIVWYFKDPLNAVALAMIDFNLHCFMDRIKASPRLLGRFQVISKDEYLNIVNDKYMVCKSVNMLRSNKYFWWSLGIDQMFHHLTHYLIIGLIFA